MAEVKLAYRDLAQVWHPDRFGQNVRLNTLATEKLKEINAAHFQLMELARPSGYVPTPTRTVEQTSPTTPPPPQPEAARPRPQPSSPPPDPQPPTPESQTKQSKATRRKVKQIKMYRRVGPYIFVIVTTLAVASIAWMMVNRGIDYYPGEHPAILCDGWHYEGGPDAGMTLSENGQATFYHAGKVEYEAHWIC